MTDKRKTAPWIQFDVAWWVEVAALLPTPWPWALIMADLRWWEDQERMGRKKRPGRPTLRKRWGVSDRQVRKALKAEDVWGGQRPDSDRTATGQETPSNHAESQDHLDRKRTATGQRAAPRAELHKNTRTQPQTSEGAKAPLPDKPDPAADTWARMLEIRARHRPKARTLKLTGYRRRVLNGRLKDHDADALLRVTEWHYTSNHHIPTFNREQGHDLDTLVRPANFDRYLEMADSEVDSSHRHKPKTNGRPPYKDIRERLAEAREMREPPPPEVVVVDFNPPPKTGADHG